MLNAPAAASPGRAGRGARWRSHARLIGVQPRLSVDELIGRLRHRLLEIAAPGIISAYLFGSYARDAAHRESDVDVAVLLDRLTYPDASARFDARVTLSSVLREAVGRDVDVVVLNDAPPLFGRRILDEGRQVLCADADADRAFALRVRIRAADILPWYRRYAKIKLDAIRG